MPVPRQGSSAVTSVVPGLSLAPPRPRGAVRCRRRRRRHGHPLVPREGAEAERAASGHPGQAAARGGQQVLRRLRGQGATMGFLEHWCFYLHQMCWNTSKSWGPYIKGQICQLGPVDTRANTVHARNGKY